MTTLSLLEDTQEPDAVRTFVVTGELDVLTAPPLVAAVAEARRRGGVHVRVDLRRLEFVDSSGLHALALIDWAAREAGGSATFARAPADVHRVFEVSGLAGRLTFVDRL